MTKPREKTREELTAEIEDGKKKIRQFENREKMLRQYLALFLPRNFSGGIAVNQFFVVAILKESTNTFQNAIDVGGLVIGLGQVKDILLDVGLLNFFNALNLIFILQILGKLKVVVDISLDCLRGQSTQFTFNLELLDAISNQHKETPFLLAYTGKKGVFRNCTIQAKKSNVCHNLQLGV